MKTIIRALALLLIFTAARVYGQGAPAFVYTTDTDTYTLKRDSVQPFYDLFINNSDDTLIIYDTGNTSCEYEGDETVPAGLGVICVVLDDMGQVVCTDEEEAPDEEYAAGEGEEESGSEEYLDYFASGRRAVPPHDTLRSRNLFGVWYKGIEPGRYQMILYYYMDNSIQDMIDPDVYEQDKDRMPMGMYKAGAMEMIVE
jgi:hypothetical protein